MSYQHLRFETPAGLFSLARRSPEQKAADRITPRLLKAAGAGITDYAVRGSLTGLFETTHDPEVYADIAARLKEEDIEIEAHRFSEERLTSLAEGGIMPPEASISLAAMQFRKTTVLRDRIMILSRDGVDTVQMDCFPTNDPNHVAQLYPPDDGDAASYHNLSVTR